MASQIRIATNIWLHFWPYLYNIKQGKKPGGLAQYAAKIELNYG
jgi:hypothetical protein